MLTQNFRMNVDVKGRMWAGSIWLRVGTIGGCCEHGDEPSGSVGEEFLARLVLSSKDRLWSIELVSNLVS